MKEFKEKGFTLIELIVVIAILGILVLLAAPKFLGHTEDAKLIQIKNDVKVVENALEIELIDDPDYITNKGWESISLETMNGYVEEGSLFDSKGNVNGELTGGEFYLIEGELSKAKLKEKFIADKGGKIYYYEKGLNVGGNESDNGPEYVLATDEDFSGESDGNFRYVGTDEYVEIPHVIKGVPVTSYHRMFEGTSVKGVKSTNANVTDIRSMFSGSQATTLDLSNFDTSRITNMGSMFSGSQATTLDLSNFDTSSVTVMTYMFYGSQATSLDLSSFDTSNVTTMYGMFQNSQATSLDLSSFDTSNVTDMRYMFSYSRATTLDLSKFDTSNATKMTYMFMDSQATKGYAKTQVDADRFNASRGKPSELTFIVHPNSQ